MSHSRVLCNSTDIDPRTEWCLRNKELNYVVVCYKQDLSQTAGLWRANNAASNLTVATFLSQLVLIITINRLLMCAFRPLRLPRIAAEILGGLLLGVSGLAGTELGFDRLFPHRSLLTLETIANLGLLFYMFLVGLEVDMKPVLKAPKKALTIAVAGFLLPFPVGYALHYMFIGDDLSNGADTIKYGPIFWGIALCTTNFPDLAQILGDLKLLHSEIGHTALSAAVITDFFSWGILVFSIATVKEGEVYTMIFGSAFVIFCLLALRPALSWAIRRKANAGFDNHHICFVLAGVVACGYVSDACGCHSILGGFMLGVIMPKGELKRALMERVEDFISGLLMPLYFLITGLRANRKEVLNGQFGIASIIGVWVIAFAAKIVSTFVAAVFVNKMKPRDGVALGLLMNTKGMLTLIVVNSARNVKVLNIPTFTVIVPALWLMTAAVGPILAFTYRSTKPSGKFQRRSLTSLETGSELRILTCFHSTREVTGIINLLDASNPTRQSPISAFAVHLIENVGRSTAMLIVHDACKNGGCGDDRDKYDSSQHVAAAAFDSFKEGKDGVSIYPLTAVSSYTTMHEDICNLAEDKDTSLIILPFQLKPIVEGRTEHANNQNFRNVNKNVIEYARCSVAVLVDRGHRPPTAVTNSSSQAGRRFIVLFVGGPDDREALVYAGRMSGNESVELTVMRAVAAANYNGGDRDREETEKILDNQCLEEFRLKTKSNPLVRLTEAVVSNEEEILKAIGTMEGEKYDLIIVGRGKGRRSPLTATDEPSWSEYPEFGPLGDTLVCSTFAPNAWILVVRQGGGDDTPPNQVQIEDSGKLREEFGHMTWQASEIETPDLAPFVSRTI
ncbi:Cation/H(+) exchanger CHX21/CHX [Trema orientale]|uniref:Cation/H(+) exchanger CHX21/CHX n=1 Tax=Trema orientale TaxID=63057 RepID=A0A2P5D3M5_TREOI|nr:Cation/H(+) exchanger CHX21/CHX [Trema orientale]